MIVTGKDNYKTIRRLAKGSDTPLSIYANGKLVYSKYPIMGTTYATQDFQLTCTTDTSTYAWQVHVLDKVGTDSEGDYYRFGIDVPSIKEWDDTFYSSGGTTSTILVDMANNLRNAFGNSAWTTTVRSVTRICTADSRKYSTSTFTRLVIGGSGIGANATRLAEVDFSEISAYVNFGTSLKIREGGAIVGLEEYANRCTAEGVTPDTRSLFNGALMSSIDFGSAQLKNLVSYASNGGYALLGNNSKLTSIGIVQQTTYQPTYINISMINGCSAIQSIDWKKWFGNSGTAAVGGLQFFSCRSLETCGGLSNLKIKEGVSLQNAFYQCLKLEDPHFETWTDEAGMGKPTFGGASTQNGFAGLGRDCAGGQYDIDVDGWTFKPTATNAPASFKLSFDGFGGDVKHVADVHFVGGGTATYLIVNPSFSSCGIKSFAMTHWTDNTNLGMYTATMSGAFRSASALTSVDMTGFQWESKHSGTPDVLTPSNASAITYIFLQASNITSLVVDFEFFDIYADYSPVFDLSPLTAWTDQTQIAAMLASLAANTSYQSQHVTSDYVTIKVSAQTFAVMTALTNWSTLIASIISNGWDITT